MAFVRETTHHVGRSTWRETEFKQPDVRHMGADESKCLQDIYCSPCKTTSGKVARLVVCAGTGAAIGAFGGPPAAAIGGGLGLGFGFCTLL